MGSLLQKTKVLEPKIPPLASGLFRQRVFGDYGVESEIETDIAVNMINQERDFLETGETYFEKINK